MTKVKSLCIFAFLLYAQILSSQCLQVEVPEDYVPTRSELIVEGEIMAREVTWDKAHTALQTTYTVNIYKVLKGDIASPSLTIVAKGGQLGEVWHQVIPEVSFTKGDIGIFLLNKFGDYSNNENLYKAWAMDQSTYVYEKETGTTSDGFRTYDLRKELLSDRITAICNSTAEIKQEFNVLQWIDTIEEESNQSRSSAIFNFSPTTIAAGADQVLTINGSNFGSTPGSIRFRYAGYPTSYIVNPSSHTISWTNSQIQVRVTKEAGSGIIEVVPTSGLIQQSISSLTISYNILSYWGTPTEQYVRYAAPTSTGGIEYHFNNTFAANTAAGEAFSRAVSTWKCITDIHWTQGSNTGINVASNDGVSVIKWSTGEISYPTLGQYNGFFFASSGNTEWCAEEFDIIFLPDGQGVTWHFGTTQPPAGRTDFESTVVHELGHALMLGHVSDPSAIMYPSSSAGTSNRIPDANAVAGAMFSMPKHQSYPSSCPSHYALTSAPAPVVKNSSNSGPGSLRQAIADACGSSPITFDAALTGSTINLGGTPIVISSNTSLTGLGSSLLTLSGNNQSRVFTIEPNIQFTLSDIRLINGKESSNGGAFYNQGITTLQNVILEGNSEGNSPKAFSTTPGKTVIIGGEVEVKE